MKEVTKEPKRFIVQETARAFSLLEEALLVSEAQDLNAERYTKVAGATRMQSSAIMSSMIRRKRPTTQTALDHFIKRVDKLESSKEPEPMPSTSGVSHIATCPPSPLLMTLQLYLGCSVTQSQTQGPQHTRLPCPPPSPRACSS